MITFINFLKENTEKVTLLDLYDIDELEDESESLYHWIDPDDYEKEFTVHILPYTQLKNLKTPIGDMTIWEAYLQFANSEQKQIVKDKVKNFDKDRIIVLANETVLDGNHHVIAAIKTKNTVKYIDIYEK